MDKMREEFEVWISQFSGQSAIQRRAAWNVWKASRAALCVELPYDETYEVEDDWDVGYFEAVSFYNQQLENLGVTLK